MALSVSVVVPNFNGSSLLLRNLPSIISALKNAEFELIVCDDASTDDSISMLRKNFPEAKIVLSESNGGFSKNCNRGIAAAKNDLIFLVNSDVMLSENYFETLFIHFENPEVFSINGKICSPDGTTIDAAKFPAIGFTNLNCTLNYETINESDETALPTFFPSGANVLMRRDFLNQLNGFNEIYSPYYFEDADLGLRAWKHGWLCLYDPRAVCSHAISSTIKSTSLSDKIKIVSRRNKLLFHQIHLHGFEKFCWRLKIFLSNLFNRIRNNKTETAAYAEYRLLKRQLKHREEGNTLSLAEVRNKIASMLPPSAIRKF